MSKSCKGLAMELVKCLSETDCVKNILPINPNQAAFGAIMRLQKSLNDSFKVQNRPYRECAGEKEPTISSECIGLRETYFSCKRGQVDMRARIRGNKGY